MRARFTTGSRGLSPQSGRALRAAASLALAVALACGAAPIAESGRAVAIRARTGAAGVRYLLASDEAGPMRDLGDDAEDLVFELFRASSGAGRFDWGKLPEGFCEEVLDPAELGCSSYASSSGTVGLVCAGARDDVERSVDGLLQRAGWQTIDREQDEPCLTYVKAGGAYRWAYVSFSQVGDAVTVTVTVLPAEGVRQ